MVDNRQKDTQMRPGMTKRTSTLGGFGMILIGRGPLVYYPDHFATPTLGVKWDVLFLCRLRYTFFFFSELTGKLW